MTIEEEIRSNRIGSNLNGYLEVLMENYHVKKKENPVLLAEMSKVLSDIYYMDINLISKEDNEVKVKLGNIIRLLGTLDMDAKVLKKLEDISKKDYTSSFGERTKRFEDLVSKLEKISSKAGKKFPELNRTTFRVDENNLKRNIAIEMSPYVHDRGEFCGLYDGITKDPLSGSWISNVKRYCDFKRRQMQGNKASIDSNEQNISISKNTSRMEIVTQYEEMRRNGEIEKGNKTFFAKLGFSPLKKRLSTKEIVEKLDNIENIIQLLDMAINAVSNAKDIDYEKTLEELKSLKSKYTSIKLKVDKDLENSDFFNMEEKVNEKRDKEREEELERLKRQKVKLLYSKMINCEDEQELSNLRMEIKAIDLSENIKNEEKRKAAIEYEQNQVNKQIENKIIGEEQKRLHEIVREDAIEIRKQAIMELGLDDAFQSQYVENGLDVRDTIANDRVEKLINDKVEEIRRRQKEALEQLGRGSR